MGGFADVKDWSGLEAETARIAAIEGMDPTELDSLKASMRTAIDNERDLVKKEQLVSRLGAAVKAAATGGLKAAVFGVLGLG